MAHVSGCQLIITTARYPVAFNILPQSRKPTFAILFGVLMSSVGLPSVTITATFVTSASIRAPLRAVNATWERNDSAAPVSVPAESQLFTPDELRLKGLSRSKDKPFVYGLSCVFSHLREKAPLEQCQQRTLLKIKMR